MAFDVLRASGIGLLAGRVLIPTPRLTAIARQGLAKVKVVESIDLVPAEGEMRIHLVLNMMGSTSRVVVRVGIAALHLNEKGGGLFLRLLEPPTFAAKNGGKSNGLLGMLGTFGEAALTSMGPDKICATVAEFIGKPLRAKNDLLIIDLGAIPKLRDMLVKETILGRIGEVVNVTGASFRPGGLEVTVQLQRKKIFNSLSRRFLG